MKAVMISGTAAAIAITPDGKTAYIATAAAVPEGLPSHAQEMAESGLDVLPVADAGSS